MERLRDSRWWNAAATRALKTIAQTSIAIIGTESMTISAVDWSAVFGAATLAGILSLLTSLAGLPEVDE